MESLVFLQVTWTCVAFSTCYTTVWFLSSVFSHVPSSHLYVTRSCHTACNRVAILQYGSSSGSSCDLTMTKTWPRFCTWMTSHLCELFFGAPNSIAFTKHFWHIICFSIVWAISCLLNIPDVEKFLSQLMPLNVFSPVWIISCIFKAFVYEKVLTLCAPKGFFSSVGHLIYLKVSWSWVTFAATFSYKSFFISVDPKYLSKNGAYNEDVQLQPHFYIDIQGIHTIRFETDTRWPVSVSKRTKYFGNGYPFQKRTSVS